MQGIKHRITSVRGTRQITQSMRLVSTSKVQKARSRMAGNQPFTQGVDALLALVSRGVRDSRHPYLKGNGSETAAIIAISSDRGLCGGYNINIRKHAAALAGELGDVKMVPVGLKIRDFCRRNNLPIGESFLGVSESPFFNDARDIGALMLEWYRGGVVGSVYIVYTQFETLLTQTPVTKKLLPLEPPEKEAPSQGYIRFEPEEESFLEDLVPFYLSSAIYGAMLESAACEQSARITSMDAAVKNADEMIHRLSLQYNRARQGAITQEVTEILGGTEALAQREE